MSVPIHLAWTLVPERVGWNSNRIQYYHKERCLCRATQGLLSASQSVSSFTLDPQKWWKYNLCQWNCEWPRLFIRHSDFSIPLEVALVQLAVFDLGSVPFSWIIPTPHYYLPLLAMMVIVGNVTMKTHFIWLNSQKYIQWARIGNFCPMGNFLVYFVYLSIGHTNGSNSLVVQ